MFAIISTIIVIATSIWVAYDAGVNKVTVNDKPYSLNNGAIAWFCSCLLLWIAAFPYYLFRRAKAVQGKQQKKKR